MEELLTRLKKIHNTTNNLGWGSCDYSPLMKTEREDTECQSVVVVGHNVYKTIYTLFIEKFNDGVFRVRVMTEGNKLDEIIAVSDDTGVVVSKVIEKLKKWFPKILR